MRCLLSMSAALSTVFLAGLTFTVAADNVLNSRKPLSISQTSDSEFKGVRCAKAQDVYRQKNVSRWTDEAGIEWGFGFKQFAKEKDAKKEDFKFSGVTLVPGNNIVCAYGARDRKGKFYSVTTRPVIANLPSNGKIEEHGNNWVNRAGVKHCGSEGSNGNEDTCEMWLAIPRDTSSQDNQSQNNMSDGVSSLSGSTNTQNGNSGTGDNSSSGTSSNSSSMNDSSSSSSNNLNQSPLHCPLASMVTEFFTQPDSHRADTGGDKGVKTDQGFMFDLMGSTANIGSDIPSLNFTGVLLYPNQMVNCFYGYTNSDGQFKGITFKLSTPLNNIKKIDTKIDGYWNWNAHGAGIFRCSPDTKGSEETCTMSFDK